MSALELRTRALLAVLCTSLILAPLCRSVAHGQNAQPQIREERPGTPQPVADVAGPAKRLEQETAPLPARLRLSFRLRAAEILQNTDPESSRRLAALGLEEIRSCDKATLDEGGLRALAVVAPNELTALVPHLSPGSDRTLLRSIVAGHQTDVAVAIYRDMVSRGDLALSFDPTPQQLLLQLVAQKSPEAESLLQQVVAKFDFASAQPEEAWRMLNIADGLRPTMLAGAVDIYDRVARAAARQDYGKDAWRGVRVKVSLGSRHIDATNSRDALLLLAGSRLYSVAPERFEKLKTVFSQWDFSHGVKVLATMFPMSPPPGAPPVTHLDPAEGAIQFEIQQTHFGGVDAPTQVGVAEIARQVRALAASEEKVNLALELANLSLSDSEFSGGALAEMAVTLASALGEATGSPEAYIQLATLKPYLPASLSKPIPALDAAATLLELRGLAARRTDIKLDGLDGRVYSLASLRGKVVLVNFWATWCGPCRQEMPAIEKLYRGLEGNGLVVVAISNEDRDTVAAFVNKYLYSFPILLDPMHKTDILFDQGALPNTYILDRQGRIVAHVIGSRTEQELTALLAKAGLNISSAVTEYAPH